VVFSVGFAILGFIIAKEMIDHVIRISSDARIIANGNLEHKIFVDRKDELGDLGKSLAELTRRIKDNMEELESYSEKTKDISLEINKRVMALSNLLHISNLISKSASLNEILELIVEKIINIGDSNLSFLILYDEANNDYILKSMHGPKSAVLTSMGLDRFRLKLGEGALGKILQARETLVLDSRQAISKEIEDFQATFSIVNTLIVPVVVRDKAYGLLGVGNEEANFVYSKSDLELINIFAKQTAIAIENDILLKKVDKLEIKDALTGLYNESYIRLRLDDEIKRAINFQRPCAFILLDIDDFATYEHQFGGIAEETALKKVASLLNDSVSDIDKVARFADSEFALVLPEKNKRQCLEIAEEIKNKIEKMFSAETNSKKRLTVSGVVTENPIDGATSDELIHKAMDILDKNKSKDKNKIWS
jgi:diguanylate cyclase (GGDEF)-like protein